ncbi:hypothetical protein [Streptomyces sp. V1I6]|uniref:hypothetical protein n=1 Tax=Streptomyces sp. V1I6 TaxID=3042273 RepID=UPI0027862425|nr:hypothetical protein [Streptomyces sp. V1I6]MDQ0842450.1 HAMP domain-containing protein [Streptomyces sp. V1I6]
MTAVDVLFAAAGYLLLVGLAARWILRRLAERRARRRARLFRDVAAYRAWRLTQLEQPLAQQHPELDRQLNQYATRIRSLYATEGDR